jgi:uncharacterized protein (DUF1499 family)
MSATSVGTENKVELRARSARLAGAFAAASVAAMALGVGGAASGILPGFVGFRLLLLGFVLAVPALAVGLVALRLTRPGRGAGGRGLAWGASIAGFAALVAVAVAAAPGRGLPTINDITTDTEDPPVFVAAGRAPANAGRDLSHPGQSFIQKQRSAYRDLAPIELGVPPAEALRRAERAAHSLGWKIVARDPAAGTLEAYDVTRIFHFVDDVVVRVRPQADGSGSVVDMRSKSRDGRGDLGANAARIRAFRDLLTGDGG